MRPIAKFLMVLVGILTYPSFVFGQAEPAPQDRPPVIPSLESPSRNTSAVEPRALGNFQLPQNAGQQWVEYDLRPYTNTLKNVERPQQAVIDWIIRETGTDVWFNEPVGILTADKATLRVYHTASMQKRVAQIYERFVNGVSEPQVFGLRMLTVSNPQWRSRAIGLMRSVPSQSAGVQAWLMPKENGAIFLSQLRERGDARELQAAEIPLYNGQLQHLEQLRSRNYLKEYARNTASPFPPYTPVSDTIQEGFRLQISSLMNLDGKSADLMLKCEIDQVERLNPVKIDLAMGPNQSQSVQIEVPQLVSWRLQERFQWPTNQVLLLSCGVVAAPGGPVDNSLAGNPPTLLGLNRILPTVGQRTDALLWVEYKGPISSQLVPSGPIAPATGTASVPTNGSISRGRY